MNCWVWSEKTVFILSNTATKFPRIHLPLHMKSALLSSHSNSNFLALNCFSSPILYIISLNHIMPDYILPTSHIFSSKLPHPGSHCSLKSVFNILTIKDWLISNAISSLSFLASLTMLNHYPSVLPQNSVYINYCIFYYRKLVPWLWQAFTRIRMTETSNIKDVSNVPEISIPFIHMGPKRTLGKVLWNTYFNYIKQSPQKPLLTVKEKKLALQKNMNQRTNVFMVFFYYLETLQKQKHSIFWHSTFWWSPVLTLAYFHYSS